MLRTKALFTPSLLSLPVLLASGLLSACDLDDSAVGPSDLGETSVNDEISPPSAKHLGLDVELTPIGPDTPVDEFAEPDPGAEAPVPPRPNDGLDYLLTKGADGTHSWISYFEKDGWLWHADDLGIGPASLISETASTAVWAYGLKWPGGTVTVNLTDELPIPTKLKILEALEEFESISPLTFVHDANATKRIDFVCWDNKYGSSTALGMSVNGQKIKVPCAPDDCEQLEDCEFEDWLVKRRTIFHEMMHALGFHHEQVRPDRDTYVTYHPECKREDYDDINFAIDYDTTMTGPYDFDSLMQYSGSSGCIQDDEGKCKDGCYTLTYASGPDAGQPLTKNTSIWMSALDQQGLHRFYGGFYDTTASDYDYVGWDTAAGDFNGDGQDDLVATAPFKSGAQGLVYSYMGIYGDNSDFSWTSSEPGIVPWREHSPLDVEDANPGAAYFGTSVISGDFNGDGYDDVAVGAPNEEGTGAVYIYEGSEFGLVPRERIQATFDGGGLPISGASFGWSLAAVDIDGDLIPELVVGAPGDMPGVGEPNCGGVYAYSVRDADDGGTAFVDRWFPSGSACHDGAEAGFAVSQGPWKVGVGYRIVVGSPGAFSDSGRAYVLRDNGGLVREATLMQGMATGCGGVGGVYSGLATEAGDRFGAAVAFGTRGYFEPVVAIGSPGEDSSAGQVDVFDRPSDLCWAREQTHQQSGSYHEAGDLFGTEIAFGDINGDDVVDMLVGAPGESYGSIKSGWIHTFGGYSGGFGSMFNFGQSTGGWTNANGERFGQAITVANFDRSRPDIVVGAPGNHSGSGSYHGALFLWRSKNAVSTPMPWRAFTLATRAPESNN